MHPSFIKNDRHFVQDVFKAFETSEDIYYYQSFPQHFNSGKPTYHLILLHGAFEYHARHNFFHNYFIKNFPANIVISAMDLRGHGQSAGERTYVRSFNDYCEDFLLFLKCLSEKSSQYDYTYFVGHSMGGLILLKTLMEFNAKISIDCQGFILSNPALKIKSSLAHRTQGLVNFLSSRWPHFRVPLLFSLGDLGRDKDSVKNYREDPLIAKSVSLKMVNELMQAAESLNSQKLYYQKPSFTLLSAQDSIVEFECTKNFMQGASGAKHQIKIYPQTYHELFREPEKEEIFSDIMNWILTTGEQHAKS